MRWVNALALGLAGVARSAIVLDAKDIEFGNPWWFVYAGVSCFLVLFAGIMSGLTLGLMSLGLVELEILQRSGTSTEKHQAAAILPVVQKQHQLLVTLLLCNACAMEALPIYLDKIFHPFVAVVLSVTFVLAFGEIIPQAICSRYGLAVGANFLWLVRVLMIICYPIAYPIGKVLDAVLGHDDSLFRRAQLKALVSIHGKEAGKGGELTHDETTIISGALDLTLKTAEEAMTPIESTFSLDVNSKLDWEAIGKILARGHSRVPVYSGNTTNIIGLLLVKNLLTVRAETETPVSAVSIRKMPRVPADMPLYDILNEFQKGSSHMAAVVKVKGKNSKPQPALGGENFEQIDSGNGNSQLTTPLLPNLHENGDSVILDVDKVSMPIPANKLKYFPQNAASTNTFTRFSDDHEDGEVIGIITLEDVFEELLQEEIVDETDVYVDVHKRIRVAAAAVVARGPQNRKSTCHKPAVDTRVLRAVAIENPKDPDAAVEVVLTEVIPYLSKVAVEDGSPAEDNLQVDSTYLDLDESTKTLSGSAYSKTNSYQDEVCRDDGNEESASSGKHEQSYVVDGSDVISLVTPIATPYANGADDHCNHVDLKTQETNYLQESSYVELGSNQGSHASSTSSKHGYGGNTGTMSGNQVADSADFDRACPCGSNSVIPGESHLEQSPIDLEVENAVVQLAPSPVQECIPDTPNGSLQLAVADPLYSDSEKPESSGAYDGLNKDVPSGDMVDFEDESAMNNVVTRSGQICRIDLLEDIIEDARNNKKTLFLAMESVISLMREVELQEKAAEQAKEEAARGGFDILLRVEDLKQMLQHAKEANNMHAGEVFGEKAILATEARELQSRLLSLADERDKSLAILDDMRRNIEERLEAAETERKVAEEEKMEKEASARNALAEQQLIMEKVVEESKILKQEAEENSKLQEFLMDRGRFVDVLQGEISVICQDVKLLKENFDERVPLSKSLSSSQTTCILASSSSSLKSMSPDLVPELAKSSETAKKTSPSPSVDYHLSSGGEESDREDRKALTDDGWEFFDNREFDM
ncbi:hypothetical protein RHMOL_Rhmol13G0029200 [Rhododendron molle]|uniref:Uncharacterized protein n=1 Tax=Rhododendron molle TaxID=49168 RepID=A0ACC0L2Y1_RHOML|nr:hypothetical protein RHMOL_Rhmol13G0029200 [Rhododendron molle]